MKSFTKFLGAAVVAGGALLAISAPASAQVSVGIGVGGYYGGYYPPAPAYSCDTYSAYYDPYRCGYPAYPYYGSAYYGPSVVIGGGYGYRGYYGGYRGGYYGGYRGGYGGGYRGGWSGGHGGGGRHR